ncbi:MAG: HDOD domain-containing protein [Desulfobacteraceae bacterium]|nr:HDOD domain-containing protein [Desulfobacteraceae bacterium]
MEAIKDIGSAGTPGSGGFMHELSILSRINRAEWLPSPDQVLARCLKLFAEEDVPVKKIGDVFKVEGGLCSQLLKVANSAFYSHSGRIDDIYHAVATVGIREVKNICLAITMARQFGHIKMAESFDLTGFWRHSMLVSFIADEFAEGRPWIKRDSARLYGLLHDMGRLAMGGCLPEYFEKALQLSRAGNLSLNEAEGALGITHTYLGWILAKKWGLPEPIRFIARWHHDPLEGAPYSREAAFINIADYLANIIIEPYGIMRAMPPSGDILALADIGRNELENYMEKAQDIIKKADVIAQIFDNIS